MKRHALWLSVLGAGVFSFCAASPARAATEFCPARVAQVFSVTGAPAIGVRLAALSPRNVTGQFLIETDRGWFRVPFAPLHVDADSPNIKMPSLYIDMPASVTLKNIWLSQAASDDPQWGPRGVVTCAPEPQRRLPSAVVKARPAGSSVGAISIAPPFSYDCAAPFAPAKVDGDVMDADAYAPGEFAEAIVDLDPSGNVVDVNSIDASGDDFVLRKKLEKRVKHMRFSPAVAYCKPVPSSYLLREGAAP